MSRAAVTVNYILCLGNSFASSVSVISLFLGVLATRKSQHQVTVLIRLARGWRRHADGLLGLTHRTHEVLELCCTTGGVGEESYCLVPLSMLPGCCVIVLPLALCHILGNRAELRDLVCYAPSASPSHFSPNTAALIAVMASSRVPGWLCYHPGVSWDTLTMQEVPEDFKKC